MKLFIPTLVLLFLCFFAIGIRIWLKGSFAETEIGRNKNMKKLGIKCVKEEETKLHAGNISTSACGACALSATCDKSKI